MKRELKTKAREAIMQAVVNGVLMASEQGMEPELVEAMRDEATKLSLRLTPDTFWRGLPGTM